MREIALDTETTGLDPFEGHRVVEIGCVEMVNRVRTGNFFHTYLNPERSVPPEAFRVHGISQEFLKDKPLFDGVASGFLEFIGESPLVIHNAVFDLRFINYELDKVGKAPLDDRRAVDTLKIARFKFPGSPASLDALCKRFKIDLSRREKHGALLDAELLADVYLELLGGSQESLNLHKNHANNYLKKEEKTVKIMEIRSHIADTEELQAHDGFLKAKIKNAIWNG